MCLPWLRRRPLPENVCQVSNCRTEGWWEIGQGSHRLRVCTKCRDELVDAGWELRRSLWNKHREITRSDDPGRLRSVDQTNPGRSS